jgi:hypothetical protein
MRTRSALVVVALVLAPACSGDGASTDTPVATSTSTAVPADEWPRVDLIAPAMAALETKLGGPQQYFEVNATSKLVNLFVALNDGKVAQPWVYLNGELSAQDGQDAQGHTFARNAVTFDSATILGQVKEQLAQSHPDAFIVEGGDNGAVRYSVVLTSVQGGQLVVILGPDGTVLSVET